jgi:hypothetical protein
MCRSAWLGTVTAVRNVALTTKRTGGLRVEDFESNLGMSRRTLLKRGAVVGGTLVWAAPAVQTLASSVAHASVLCNSTTCTEVFDRHGNLKGHLCCTPTNPADNNCPCACAGELPNSSCPEPDPCNIAFTCVGAAAPIPGPCGPGVCP